MNKYFSFNRFVKYFKYDVINAKNNYGLNALILGFLPLFVFLVVNIFSLIIVGRWSYGSIAIPIVSYSCALLVTVFSAGVKLYGNLTEKKAGSNWLLIPASTLEKTLSMIIITCVLIPAFIGVILVLCDLLLHNLPGYGDSLISEITWLLNKSKESGLTINAVGLAWVEWSVSILVFTLGAVFFKKAKMAKTFLSVMLISSVFGSIMGSLAINGSDFFQSIVEALTTGGTASLQTGTNLMINVSNILSFLILGGGLYWRLKTLKH